MDTDKINHGTHGKHGKKEVHIDAQDKQDTRVSENRFIADSWVESRQGRSNIARHFNGGMKAKKGPASPAGTAERLSGKNFEENARSLRMI